MRLCLAFFIRVSFIRFIRSFIAGLAETIGLTSDDAVDESAEAESKIGVESGRGGSQDGVLPCAFVVGVLTRNWRDYVCSYVPKETQEAAESTASAKSGWLVVTPWDRRIPRIRIFTSEPSKLSGIR